MGRISTVFALVAPLLLLQPRLADAGGALDAVTEGASSLFGTPPSTPPGESVVVAAPLAADEPVPRGDELALRVAARVAARIGAGARVQPQTAQLATARAIAGRASALVYVRTAIARGDLRTTLDVYPSIANAWDRIRNPMPLPTSHAFASAKIDAGVRAWLSPLVLEQASVERARHDEGDVLAAACGDVDGDGDDEIVLVSAARVALGRIREGRFVAERTAAWSSLGPPLAVPMREPIAEAVIAKGAVMVGSTGYGGMRLTPALAVAAPLLGLPVWGGDDVVCLRPEPSAGAFDGAPVECPLRRDPRPRMAVPAPRFDAFGAALVADALGNSRTVVAVREPSGRLRLKVRRCAGRRRRGVRRAARGRRPRSGRPGRDRHERRPARWRVRPGGPTTRSTSPRGRSVHQARPPHPAPPARPPHPARPARPLHPLHPARPARPADPERPADPTCVCAFTSPRPAGCARWRCAHRETTASPRWSRWSAAKCGSCAQAWLRPPARRRGARGRDDRAKAAAGSRGFAMIARRRLLTGSIAALACVAARSAPARGRTPYGASLALHVPWPAGSLDPHRIDDAMAAFFGEALFDTLYAPDESGALAPALAAGDPQPEGAGLRVTLRPGLRFASGTPLDARAVVESIARARAHDASRVARRTSRRRGLRAKASSSRCAMPDALVRALASPLVAVVAAAIRARAPRWQRPVPGRAGGGRASPRAQRAGRERPGVPRRDRRPARAGPRCASSSLRERGRRRRVARLLSSRAPAWLEELRREGPSRGRSSGRESWRAPSTLRARRRPSPTGCRTRCSRRSSSATPGSRVQRAGRVRRASSSSPRTRPGSSRPRARSPWRCRRRDARSRLVPSRPQISRRAARRAPSS